ncbi:TadE/TadG family type IV pilus assembly protein [Rhodobacter capsulatus]|uniref:TadE/TadG family type IV pilus assembly protein n=1 Tax=Rhodobacter capsulatus TaxID=1061 RepID=UPI00402822E5
MVSKLYQWLRWVRRSEEGAVTIPAIMWLPFFVMIMAASVDMSVLIIKQTLFDRGVDLSTRILKLGIESLPTHEQLKSSICNNIAFVSNCMDRLAVEVFPIDTDTWTSTNASGLVCTDSSSAVALSPQIERGGSEQLMMLRACLKIDTMMALDPFALALQRDAGGQVALVSITAFVNEQ